jgi:nicotinate-nucleotide adenylyltransferase
MTRTGIFGGSFNPIHAAHLVVAERARDERSLDRILFIPARQPPHKPAKPVAPAEDRLRMVELAIQGNDSFEASRLELDRAGPSYTLTTVRQLRDGLGKDAELFLVLGADSVHDMPTWWHARDLVREVEIIPVVRPGYSLEKDLDDLSRMFGADWARRVRELTVHAPSMDISSTEIRERVAAGRSIRYLVPEPVRQYILSRGLYA